MAATPIFVGNRSDGLTGVNGLVGGTDSVLARVINVFGLRCGKLTQMGGGAITVTVTGTGNTAPTP